MNMPKHKATVEVVAVEVWCPKCRALFEDPAPPRTFNLTQESLKRLGARTEFIENRNGTTREFVTAVVTCPECGEVLALPEEARLLLCGG